MKRAWRVGCSRISDEAGITSGVSRSAAIATALASARDAGYRVMFVDFRARRAPEFDTWAAAQARPRFLAEEYVRIEAAGPATRRSA